MSALSFTAFSAVTRKEPPLTLMTVLLPRAPVASAWSVPVEMVVVPVKPVLSPVRTWVLAPSFTRAELLPPVMRPA